jgi:hypothetical protein
VCRPERLLRPRAVGQEIQVVAHRRRGFVVAAGPFEHVAERVVILGLPAVQGDCRPRLFKGILQEIASRERFGEAVPCARLIGEKGRGPTVVRLGFVEETGRPERVSVKRQYLSVARFLGRKPLGLEAGPPEIGRPNQRTDQTEFCTPPQWASCRRPRPFVRLDGGGVARLLEEQVGKLELNFDVAALPRAQGRSKRERAHKRRERGPRPERQQHQRPPRSLRVGNACPSL